MKLFTFRQNNVSDFIEGRLEKMKNEISETLRMFDQDKITDMHLRWEFLKYEIRKFTRNFSEKICQRRK